ncbi:E6 [Caretta caretta papillomavirus 1]|uniref:E6 n=1 Tax=Caretta caretta papillomavirus 1 TaxID=485241 RepID=B6RUP8_9PAPI|nr:E6 [Caretta caretta papillomavirus 1]ACD39812.1 E6 [Caretta caretta papillomavirus 1]
MPPCSASLHAAFSRYAKLRKLCKRLRIDIGQLHVSCVYCKKQLSELEVLHLLEDGGPFAVTKGKKKKERRCFAACCRCRLFLDNA